MIANTTSQKGVQIQQTTFNKVDLVNTHPIMY